MNLTNIGRSLRHRNFRLFFLGQLISLVGTWMQAVAQSWLIYRLTGSAALLGWVSFAGQFPVFLLAVFGGVLTDRYDRRRLIVGTQFASMLLAAILGVLTLAGMIQTWEILVLSALLGIVNAFDIPARQTFIVDMVGRDDLPNAIALNSSMVNGARLVGPAVAGLLVAAIGEGWCFGANSASYIAVIAGLLLMRLPQRDASAHRGPALTHIAEGFRFVFDTHPIRALLLLMGIVSLVGMPFSVLMPIFADRILHGGPQALGLLMGGSGAGALVAALILAARTGLKGLGRWIMVSTAAFGICLMLFAQSHQLWLSVSILAPAGMFVMIQSAASNTLIQSMSPDRLRGRVMSVYSMMFMGMAPFGALLAGSLSHRFGAPLIVTCGGICTIIAALVFGSRLKALRAEARELVAEREMEAGAPAEELTR